MLQSSMLGRMHHVHCRKRSQRLTLHALDAIQAELERCCDTELPGDSNIVCCGVTALGSGGSSTWPLTPLMCSKASLLASQQILCSCCSPPSFLAPPLTKRPMRPPCDSCPSHASSLSAAEQAGSLSQLRSSSASSQCCTVYHSTQVYLTTVLLKSSASRAP